MIFTRTEKELVNRAWAYFENALTQNWSDGPRLYRAMRYEHTQRKGETQLVRCLAMREVLEEVDGRPYSVRELHSLSDGFLIVRVLGAVYAGKFADSARTERMLELMREAVELHARKMNEQLASFAQLGERA